MGGTLACLHTPTQHLCCSSGGGGHGDIVIKVMG